ncbi:MAG: OmpH family outer membrane protein [Lactobacillales bacterium]|nr:OmpH family outer membrane protein [Lactobacillales bacterium]
MKKMNMDKITSIVLVVILAFFVWHVFAGDGGKIAVVNIEKLRVESTLFQKIAVEDQKRQLSMEKQFMAIDAMIKKEDSDLRAKEKTMKSAEYAKERKALENKVAATQMQLSEQVRQIQTIAQMVAAQSEPYLKDVVDGYAKSKGYDVILAAGVTVYAKESLDVTDDIIAAFNKKTENVSYEDLKNKFEEVYKENLQKNQPQAAEDKAQKTAAETPVKEKTNKEAK